MPCLMVDNVARESELSLAENVVLEQKPAHLVGQRRAMGWRITTSMRPRHTR